MSGTNGTGVLPLRRVIELGDLSEETVAVTVMRDGQPVDLVGYVNGDRTFLARAVAFSAVRKGYHAAVDEAGADVDDDAKFMMWLSFLSLAVREVVRDKDGNPGLSEEEATLMAFNGPAVTLLEDLGWLPRRDAEPPDPEAPGGGSPTTGGSSSPISASTTTAAEPI